MKKTKNQTCIDCLHCKVSAKSTINNRLCFCEKGKKDERHRELHWLVKKTCEDFENMGA